MLDDIYIKINIWREKKHFSIFYTSFKLREAFKKNKQ